MPSQLVMEAKPSWRRIGGMVFVFVALAAAIAIAYRPASQNETALATPLPRDAEVEFALTSAFAAENDVAVLTAAFAHTCKATTDYLVLSDEAIDRFDGRTGTTLGQIPTKFECSGVKRASESLIDQAFNRPVKPTKDLKRLGQWGGFYDQFPGASGLMRISMPVYSNGGAHASVYADFSGCRMCGAGWEIVLVKTNGHWTIHDQVSRWIA